MTHRMSRRGFVAATASLPFLLAACGSDDEESGGAKPAGPWKFTDDRGVTVSLDRRPERLILHEYAVAGMWDYGIRPTGVYGSVPMAKQPMYEDLDLSGVKSVGDVWGEVNIEALAALRPDLIVTTWWPSEKLLGGVKDDKVRKKLEAVAPIVGIQAQKPATTTIEHFEKLAGTLGGDASKVADIRRRYDRAVAGFKAAAKAKPDVRVVAAYADPEALYVGKTSDYSDLKEYAAWGLNLADVKSKDPYWDKLSWENADKYPADLILYDARAHAPKLDKLMDIPLFRRLPAVKAKQLSPWHMEEAVSYRLFASHIEELTGRLETARVVA
jgi:iron complex transport system substrate-binding protein